MRTGADAGDQGTSAPLDGQRRLGVAAVSALTIGVGVGLGAAHVLMGLATAVVMFPVLFLAAPWLARRGTKVRLPPSEVVNREVVGVREGIGFFLLLCIRGFALWALWPLSFVVWALHAPVGWMRHRPLRLRKVAGWFDTNYIALLESTLLRPFVQHRTPFLKWPRVMEVDRGPAVSDLW